MDWIYGYLAALRHVELAGSMRSVWGVPEFIALGSLMTTIVVGGAMWRVASASERAATSAANAAQFSNNINIRQQVYDLRQQAVIDASNTFDRISNLPHEFIGQGYEIQRSLDLAKFRQNQTETEANIIRELDFKLLVTDGELNEFVADLGDRGRSVLEEAMTIAAHSDFDEVMVRLLKLKVDVNYAFSHVRSRYANIQGLLNYGRDGAA